MTKRPRKRLSPPPHRLTLPRGSHGLARVNPSHCEGNAGRIVPARPSNGIAMTPDNPNVSGRCPSNLLQRRKVTRSPCNAGGLRTNPFRCSASPALRRPPEGIAVGMALSGHPPHRSVLEELPHTAPTSGAQRKSVCRFSHPVQSARRLPRPLRVGHGRPNSVPLGHRPSLGSLLRRLPRAGVRCRSGAWLFRRFRFTCPFSSGHGVGSSRSLASFDPSSVLCRCQTSRRRAWRSYGLGLSRPVRTHGLPCGRLRDLPVLAHGVSIHARGLRLRGTARAARV